MLMYALFRGFASFMVACIIFCHELLAQADSPSPSSHPTISDTDWLSMNMHLMNFTSGDYDPTSEEIERGLLIKPTSCWGTILREQKSIRVLALGGSNTAGSKSKSDDPIFKWKYPELLDEAFRKLRLPGSYVINEGVGGTIPEYNVGITWKFEHQLPPDEW
jgi:hypothetical protein